MTVAVAVRGAERGSAPPTLKSDIMVQRLAQLRRRVGSACAQANSAAGTSDLYSAAATEAAIGFVELAKLDATWAALEAYMVEPLPEDPSALTDGRSTPVLMRSRWSIAKPRPENAPPPPGAEPADGPRRAGTAPARSSGRPSTSAGLCGQATHLEVLISPRAPECMGPCGRTLSASVGAEEAGGRQLPGRLAAAQRGLDDLSLRRRRMPDGKGLVFRQARAVSARAARASSSCTADGGGGAVGDTERTLVWRVGGGAVGRVGALAASVTPGRPQTAQHWRRPRPDGAPPRPESQPDGGFGVGNDGIGTVGFSPRALPLDAAAASPDERCSEVWLDGEGDGSPGRRGLR
eukprot:scaffold13136_cov118-Isochrysis_galbana.AAC.1